MSNATKPTRVEKVQKQIATRLKKTEKALPAAWEAATSVGYTPETLEKKSNWRFESAPEYAAMHSLPGEARSAIYSYYTLADDLRRSLSDLQDALFCEAKKAASAAKKAEKEEAEKGLRMVCQICGRGILSNTGFVAHHGYERPGGGWQTESCDGARFLPIEASTVVLESHIEGQIRALGGMKIVLENLNNETSSIAFTMVEGYGRNKKETTVFLTRSNFEETKAENAGAFLHNSLYSFDRLKERAVASQEQKIRQQADYIEWQKGRLEKAQKAGVTHVFDAENGVWVEVHD